VSCLSKQANKKETKNIYTHVQCIPASVDSKPIHPQPHPPLLLLINVLCIDLSYLPTEVPASEEKA